MSKTDAFETAVLKLYVNGTTVTNIADNTATAPATNLYFSLHTADPGETGNQSTNEIAYTSYARVAVARTTGGFTVTGNTASPVATVSFPAGTGGTGTAVFFGLGLSPTGTGTLLYSGPIGAVLGPFTGDTAGNITIPAAGSGPGLSVGSNITFNAAYGQALPVGLTSGTVYFVKTVSGNVITVSATSGGSTIVPSVAGDGVAYSVTPIVCGNLITPQLSTATVIAED